MKNRSAITLLLVALSFWCGLALLRGGDWYGCFHPALTQVAGGSLPYETVSCALHPLPLYLLLLPFAYLPTSAGLVIVVATTVLASLLLTKQSGGYGWQSSLATLACPFLGAFAVGGQVTGLEIAGLYLLLRAKEEARDGLAGLSLLPFYAVLPHGILLGLWGARTSAVYILATAGALIPLALSFYLFGNWIPEWIAGLQVLPEVAGPSINASIWYRPLPIAALVVGYVALSTFIVAPHFERLPALDQVILLLGNVLLLSPHVLPYRLLPFYLLMVGWLAGRDNRLPVALLVVAYALHLAGEPGAIVLLAHGAVVGYLLYSEYRTNGGKTYVAGT